MQEWISKSALASRYGGAIVDTAKRAYSCDGEQEDGRNRSLRTLCQEYLGRKLPSLPPSTGSWAQRPLPEEMIRRAAMEAHVLMLLKDSIEYWTPRRTDWEEWLGGADH